MLPKLTPPPRPQPCVISITWMCDAMVCVPELYDERDNLYVIRDHGYRVLLGHALFATKEVTWPLRVMHQFVWPSGNIS